MSFSGKVEKGSSGSALDAPIAALAGLSVAFAAFTIPADLLGELVLANGLPQFVPMTEPPLGLNARLLLAGFGAIAVFAFCFILLRLLGRIGRRPRAVRHEEYEESPIRLRRRDLHPDAPPPSPLRARDLGEPLTPGLWDRSARDRAEPEPAPVAQPEPELEELLLADACETAFEPEPEPEPEPAPRPIRITEPKAPVHQRTRRSWLREAVIESEPAPVAEAPAPAPAARNEETAPAPVESAPEPEEIIVVASRPAVAAPEPRPEPSPAPEPAGLTAVPEDDHPSAIVDEEEPSLAELIERLQAGMTRRRRPAAPEPSAQPVAMFGASADERLQSAIDSLQRLAARQG